MADSKEELARKARALAEKSFLAGNVYGAQQWMQSAAKLAPNLHGNAQAAAAYDVHAAARRRHGGAPDWYAVLGLPHPASGAVLTHDAIKRQHRSLCLLVHPDKNPSAAADGAFKLVQAAWDALSTRHPPAGTGAAAPAPPPTRAPAPPPRPPDPQPQPRPRPQVVQMPRRAAPPTAGYTYTRAAQPERGRHAPPPPPSRRSPSPTAGRCPKCNAPTTIGKRNFRCLSCHWSPMDDRQDDDDDYDDEDW
ncbi:hypothetical protein ACP70R_001304 [Stipagrostis hirtigluma subsp. patula]